MPYAGGSLTQTATSGAGVLDSAGGCVCPSDKFFPSMLRNLDCTQQPWRVPVADGAGTEHISQPVAV